VPFGGSLNLPSYLTLHEAYFILTVFINVYTSAAIALKLMLHRRSLKLTRDDSGIGKSTTVVGILCESAAIYAVVGVVYIPLYMRQATAVTFISTLFGVLAVCKGLEMRIGCSDLLGSS
jgi:hypothetical protein